MKTHHQAIPQETAETHKKQTEDLNLEPISIELQLAIYKKLQASLNPEEILEILLVSMPNAWSVVKMSWSNPPHKTISLVSNPGEMAYKHKSVLQLSGQHLGSVTLFFQEKPTQAILNAAIEMIGYISHPLCNALKYKDAMNSAIHDPLTQLLNRKAMTKNLCASFDSAVRYKSELSLLLVDIDHFKKINDTHGHQVGDEVLKHLAFLLKEGCRGADQAFRFGGEEFLISLPSTDIQGAVELAERLKKAIEFNDFGNLIPENQLPITVSIGVSSLQPDDSLESIIYRADKALYKAKAEGRNQVVQIANNE